MLSIWVARSLPLPLELEQRSVSVTLPLTCSCNVGFRHNLFGSLSMKYECCLCGFPGLSWLHLIFGFSRMLVSNLSHPRLLLFSLIASPPCGLTSPSDYSFSPLRDNSLNYLRIIPPAAKTISKMQTRGGWLTRCREALASPMLRLYSESKPWEQSQETGPFRCLVGVKGGRETHH